MDLVAVMNTYAVSAFYAIAVDEQPAPGRPALASPNKKVSGEPLLRSCTQAKRNSSELTSLKFRRPVENDSDRSWSCVDWPHHQKPSIRCETIRRGLARSQEHTFEKQRGRFEVKAGSSVNLDRHDFVRAASVEQFTAVL
jgi:hypothetical protein